MALDFAGRVFRPRRHFDDVLYTQGRVRLDWEENEGFFARDRRWRVETMDLAGRSGYPVDLPDSFRITVAAGELRIGPGRYYVDGRIAENFGRMADLGGSEYFDGAHEELRSTEALPFVQQPYRLGLSPPQPQGTMLVYLDVWSREVDYLKDPALIEPAVGVDTAGRAQTVWQVRTMQVPASVDCQTPDDEIPDWGALTAPSTIRLDSRPVPVTDPDNLCELPPTFGYRSLESRTYRVEVHEVDSNGEVWLKWSRYNASVATRVVTIDTPSQLTVEQVARDDVKRFGPGDWVEVIDDRLELDRLPGSMHRVASVDPATNVIVLDTPLPAGEFPTSGNGTPSPDRNLRVIKWDQRGTPTTLEGTALGNLGNSNGPGVFRAPPAGETLPIEAGIGIAIGSDGPTLIARTGDCWIFRGYSTDGTIDELTGAPPLGIHHHYARLAVVRPTPGGLAVDDCRDPIQEESCCTVIVRPGESIQNAIDSLPNAGGCVCLKPGLHVLQAPMRIERPFVTLHGEAQGVRVRAPAGEPALRVTADAVRVATIRFVGRGRSDGTALFVGRRLERLSVEDCTFSYADGGPTRVGVRLEACLEVQVSSCRFAGGIAGVWAVGSGDLHVDRCDIDLAARVPGLFGIAHEEARGPIFVTDCEIVGAVYGVVVNDDLVGPPGSLAMGSSIAGNRIECAAPFDGVPGVPAGIDLAADESHVVDNLIGHSGSGGRAGIRIAASAVRVENNVCRLRTDLNGEAFGIQVGVVDEREVLVRDVLVSGNRVEGEQNGIGVLRASNVRVVDNTLFNEIGREGDGFGLLGIFTFRTLTSTVEGNLVNGAPLGVLGSTDIELDCRDNRTVGGAIGLGFLLQLNLRVHGNRVVGANTAGMVLLGMIGPARVSANRVFGCGFGAPVGYGIGALLCGGQLAITDNHVMDTQSQGSGRAIGIFGDLVLEALVANNQVGYSPQAVRSPVLEDRALRMRGYLFQRTFLSESTRTVGFPIQIVGNSFAGTGRTALVEVFEQMLTDSLVIGFERITFSDNDCMHVAGPVDDGRATVSLTRRAIVMGNHIRATVPDYFPLNMNGESMIWIGNIGENGPVQFSGQLPPNIANFNVNL